MIVESIGRAQNRVNAGAELTRPSDSRADYSNPPLPSQWNDRFPPTAHRKGCVHLQPKHSELRQLLFASQKIADRRGTVRRGLTSERFLNLGLERLDQFLLVVGHF